MTTFRSVLCGIFCYAAFGPVQAEPPDREESPAKVRLGVYDSRAIAVAAIGSEYYTHHIKPLEDAFRKAKADGNEKLIRELEPKVWARRKQTHRQGFSTAPVDDILEYIKDDLPKIATRAGVGPIISKWDKEALARHKAAERVDITMLLVEAFKPREKSLKWAIEIQKKPPVPMKDLEEHIATEGH